jgi:D-sedoheptulose 7-phosphate isomerase
MTGTLSRHLQEAPDIGVFACGYFARLEAACSAIDPASIRALAAEFEAARTEGSTVWVIGNGGSAANANHIANGLSSHLLNRAGRGFSVQSLVSNNVALTAIPNDQGFDDVFLGQLSVHYRPGDRLLAISCSGHSPNVLRAAEWVQARGGVVIGFCGFDGGELRAVADVVVHVPTEPGEYGPVEDAHMALAHVLVHWFEAHP